jgi:hypothetical protein
MNDETCRITAAGIKKLLPCGRHSNAQCGETPTKEHRNLPDKKKNQRKEKQKNFFNFGIIIVV